MSRIRRVHRRASRSMPFSGVQRPRQAWRQVAGMGLATGALLACSEGVTAPNRATSVSLSVVAGAVGGPGISTALTDGTHELTLTRVVLVAREVALGSESGGQALEEGPFPVDVPLDGAVRSLVAAAVRPAQYDQVRLVLQSVQVGDSTDAAFLAAHPDLEGISVLVEGAFDGSPFLYGRSLDDLARLTLDPPLDVDGRTANVTLRLDVAAWFRADDGTLVDPGSAGGDDAVARGVERRIGESIEAFEDADADGVAGSD